MNEEEQQDRICCRTAEIPRVQCDECTGMEDADIAVRKTLCESCQDKLARYDRLIIALRTIESRLFIYDARKDAEAALKYCGEEYEHC